MSLKWIIANWRIVAAGGILLAVFAFGYNTGAFVVRSQWSAQQLEEANENLAAKEWNSQTILKLERERNEAIAEISNYWADHPLGGVHVPKAPRCPSSDTRRGVPPPTGERPFPESVAQSGGEDKRGIAGGNALTQEAYEQAVQYAMDSLVATGKRITLEADVAVENCRVATEYLKSLAR